MYIYTYIYKFEYIIIYKHFNTVVSLIYSFKSIFANNLHMMNPQDSQSALDHADDKKIIEYLKLKKIEKIANLKLKLDIEKVEKFELSLK